MPGERGRRPAAAIACVTGVVESCVTDIDLGCLEDSFDCFGDCAADLQACFP